MEFVLFFFACFMEKKNSRYSDWLRAEQEFPLLHVVQTDSGDHPASYPISTGVKRPGCEADQSSPTSAGQENVNLYIHSSIRLHGTVLN
jgi:hypothetical protein